MGALALIVGSLGIFSSGATTDGHFAKGMQPQQYLTTFACSRVGEPVPCSYYPSTHTELHSLCLAAL